MSQNYFQITRSYFKKYFFFPQTPFFQNPKKPWGFSKIQSRLHRTQIHRSGGRQVVIWQDSRGRKKMQGAGRAVIRRLRSSPSLSFPSSTIRSPSILGFLSGSRVFSQSAAAAAPSLDKEEATSRVLSLLKSIHFIDPSKVSTTSSLISLSSYL